MEALLDLIKTILLIPLGIVVATIMGASDAPRHIQDNTPKTQEDIYWDQSVNASEPGDCIGLPTQGGYLDSCYKNVADLSANVNNCAFIQNKDIRNTCITKVINSCDDLNGPVYINKCYSDIATFYSDSKWCEKISTEDTREKCKNEYNK